MDSEANKYKNKIVYKGITGTKSTYGSTITENLGPAKEQTENT